jgi:transcription elongation factor GreA
MEDRVPMTREGYESLMKDLKRLKGVERPKIVKEISVAREHGDLSENAEYEAAKDKQFLLEKKIEQIEYKLARAEVIDTATIDTDKVVFGVTVHLQDENSGKIVCYQIVGSDEADARKGKISINAPLARALIGKEVNETVEVKLPGEVKEYTILRIDSGN